MDNHKEIKSILLTLANGFPSFAPGNPTGMLNSYSLALSDVGTEALMDAAISLMRKSKFFPSISELRMEAMKFNHYRPQPDKLRIEAYRLEDKFAAGNFKPDEWERLAVRFEQAGREEAAAGLRRQLHGRMEQIKEAA